MKTASAINYERATVEIKYRQLCEYPESQTEAIAHHYTAVATFALQLLHALDMYRQAPSPEFSTMITYMVEEIKRQHKIDFGLELEWPRK